MRLVSKSQRRKVLDKDLGTRQVSALQIFQDDCLLMLC
jgi:hypothetical protein